MVWQPYRVGYIDRIQTPPNSSVSVSAQPTDSMYGTIIPSHLAVQNGRGTERVSIIIDGVMYECGQFSNIALPIEDAYNITISNGNNFDLEVLMIDTIHAERYLARYTSFPAPLSSEEVAGPQIISAVETSCSNGADGTADIVVGNQLQSSESVTVTVGGSGSTKTIPPGGTETYPFTLLTPGDHPVSAVYDRNGRSSFSSLHMSLCPPPQGDNPVFIIPWSSSVESDVYSAPGDGVPVVNRLGLSSAISVSDHPYASSALSNTNSNTTNSGANIEASAFIGRFVQIGFWLLSTGIDTADVSGMQILSISLGSNYTITDSLIGYEPSSSTVLGCVSNTSRHAITPAAGWKWIVVRVDRASPYVSIYVDGTLLAQGVSDSGTVGTETGRIVVRVTNRAASPNMTRVCDLRVWDKYSDAGIVPPSFYFTY